MQNYNNYSHKDYVESNKPEEEVLYNDWRLPTIKELLTLVDYSKCNPASTSYITSNCYWSSTTDASDTSLAWSVSFNDGYTNYYDKTYALYVLCVRDSEHGLQWSDDAPNKMKWNEAMKYVKNLVAPVRKDK